VIDVGGKDRFREKLKGLALQQEFREMVTSLGIVRDADSDAKAAFMSLQGALQAAGLPLPSEPYSMCPGSPGVGVAILPDSAREGNLETLCVESVKDEPAMNCVEEYFGCLEKRCACTPRHPWKARAQAYLASCPEPDISVGPASREGYWKLDSPVFEQVKVFLRNL
jgi:hypothetical protein